MQNSLCFYLPFTTKAKIYKHTDKFVPFRKFPTYLYLNISAMFFNLSNIAIMVVVNEII